MHDAFAHDPWKMLVAVILSQRATDLATIKVASTLYAQADTPQKLLTLSTQQIESIIKPIGFFHQKTRGLQKLANIIIKTHAGQVPLEEPALLALPMVGQKTTNIMLSLYTGTPKIAVDIHVHRISNRLGWINSKTPKETEKKLTKMIPKDWIAIVNQIFVRHGQEICRPISPKCSICPIHHLCKRLGVSSHR